MFAFDHFLLKKTVVIFTETMLAMLNKLLQRVGPGATKADSSWREHLQPGLKLTVILKYLAPYDKYCIQYLYHVVLLGLTIHQKRLNLLGDR